MNTVYTIEEYIQQGFTPEEAPLVRKCDILFNNWENLSEAEKAHYFSMVKYLGI